MTTTMISATTRMDLRDWSQLVLLSILWGGTFFFTGVALRELPPLTLVFVRLLLAALILLPVMLMAGHRFPSNWSGWKPFVVMAAINNAIPFSLIVTGQTFIPSGTASVVNATTPLFTVLVLAAFGDERLIARRIAGVLLGLVGVAILRGQNLDFGSRQSVGILFCLGATLSFGFSSLWANRHLNQHPPLMTATLQLVSSSAMMAVVAFAIDRPWHLPMPSLATCLAVLGLASLSTALAFIIFFRVMARAGASNAMLVTLMVPVTALFLGAVVLGENVGLREIAGALVIASALLVMDGRVFAAFRRTPTA